ncbi:MAG TPA: hypothetical protein VFT13_00410 [Candidatus Krumholzibacteria bacterium]|nr:hypothetical protein [Candidatus Krumholzibacteria bacterium]
MSRNERCSIRTALAAALALIALSGCASDSRSGQAIDWVVSQEADKKRLNDAGFPQYSGAN